MTNEQMLNAMIPGALKRLEDAGSHEYIGSTAMVSASDLRVLLAHVAAKDAEIERLKAQLAESEPAAWRIQQGARVYIISNAEFVRSSFDAAAMTPLYERVIQ